MSQKQNSERLHKKNGKEKEKKRYQKEEILRVLTNRIMSKD
jgi:hypothetical protein